MRPIALQDNLAKTQAAERMNQIQKAHGEMEQRLAAATLKEKSASDVKKTRAGEKADMVIIKKEEEEQQKQRQKKKRQNPEDQEEGASEHLDISG